MGQGLPIWAKTPARSALWKRTIGRATAIALFTVAVAAAVATIFFLNSAPTVEQGSNTVALLLYLDLAILIILGAVIAHRTYRLWSQRRSGAAGSRLHIKFTLLFACVAVTPAILVALFSLIFIRYGVEAWFGEKVKTAITESLQVAEAYLVEHQNAIRGDALAMANDLNRLGPQAYFRNPNEFNRFVALQTMARSLSEVAVVDGNGRVLARVGLSFIFGSSFDFQELQFAIERARQGEVAILVNEGDDRVRAVVALNNFENTFLYVVRLVDPRVLNYMERTQDAASEYGRLQGQVADLQLASAAVYGVVALLLLLAAIWTGLTFASALSLPITRLISASEKVRAGELSTRVPEDDTQDEIGVLARSFNRMTSQLEGQRADLEIAYHQNDARRRFTEAVLSGVSAGVIGVDTQGIIELPNRVAAELLGVAEGALIRRSLTDVLPEIADLFAEAQRRPDRIVQAQLRIKRGIESRAMLARITSETTPGGVVGYVVTLDDITELVSAQRKAAWADVARRIAHEIKNPLTPIQLSAERLKRKYLKQINSDSDTFVACTETIIRQVGDIGRMVDEFSSFARMPNPVIEPSDLAKICREALLLQKTARTDIAFDDEIPAEPVIIACDPRQVGQALTNLLQNALDAIEGRREREVADGISPLVSGRVKLALRRGSDDTVAVTVIDNGRGLPEEGRERLTEPYVTTRQKGTGLGLAIVKKIMEDHSGSLVLDDAPGGGAQVTLVFPAVSTQSLDQGRMAEIVGLARNA